MNTLMNSKDDALHLSFGQVKVHVFKSKTDLGRAAAREAAEVIRAAITVSGLARIIVATGNSQINLVEALTEEAIDWSKVDIFHMDEYVALPASHPSSFRYWIANRLVDKVHPRTAHYINGEATDLDAEIQRYTRLLTEGAIHLAFVGFGENGHIAFNDPPVADFSDPATVKRVILDDACRRQQAGEGHFSSADSVPPEAITITCPGLFRAKAWISSVPDSRKAQAVKNALEGPLTTRCPASLVKQHPHASVYLDHDSASMLSSAAIAR